MAPNTAPHVSFEHISENTLLVPKSRMRCELTDRELLPGRLFQVLVVISGTISIVADGMQYGWSAPVIPILESPETPVRIQKEDIVWLENIYMLGAFAGLPFTIYMVDKIGRKKSLLAAASVNLIGWILIALADRVETLYVARFLTGFASDVAFVSAPMYIAEIADEKIRGFLCSLTYIMMLVGILVVYAVAPFVTVLTSSIVGASFLIFQLCTFSFMPRSPYYLLIKGDKEGARKSLQRLRRVSDVDKILQEISMAVERENCKRGNFLDLVTVKSNRKALIIAIVLNGGQHFSSISVILMNIHTILADAASDIKPSTTAVIFSVLMLISAVTAASLIDKFGRRVLLGTSNFLTGLSLLLLASYFAVKEANYDVSTFTWLPVAAVMLYAIFFKMGMGLVPSVLVGELFPTNVKAVGMTIADSSYVLLAAISIYLYQFLANTYGMHVPFFLFGAVCLSLTLFVIFYIPETKGKTLEEIQDMLKGQSPRKDLESHINPAMEHT